jgi:glutathione S-transferase
MRRSANGVVLEDGDFLTESSAILKYLADKIDSPAYPKDLRKRARVNEMMDWLNTGFYRDFGYGLVYPQIFPHHKRRSDEAQAGAVEWGKQKAKFWLGVLDQHFKPGGSTCAAATAIAASGREIFRWARSSCLPRYPNLARWFEAIAPLIGQARSLLRHGRRSGKSVRAV